MTTIVKLSPHPVEGLKVQVDVVSASGHGYTTYMKNGDPERVFVVHDSQSVRIAEVPDTPAQGIQNDGQTHALKG